MVAVAVARRSCPGSSLLNEESLMGAVAGLAVGRLDDDAVNRAIGLLAHLGRWVFGRTPAKLQAFAEKFGYATTTEAASIA
jgi:hypothetical protein